MCGSKNGSILHMSFQIPKLGQTNSCNIDNICRIRDWDFGIRSLERGDERHDEGEEILVQGE